MKHQKRDRWFVASLQAKRLREFRLAKSIFFFHTAQADFSQVSVPQLKRGADRVVGEDTSDFPEFVKSANRISESNFFEKINRYCDSSSMATIVLSLLQQSKVLQDSGVFLFRLFWIFL